MKLSTHDTPKGWNIYNSAPNKAPPPRRASNHLQTTPPSSRTYIKQFPDGPILRPTGKMYFFATLCKASPLRKNDFESRETLVNTAFQTNYAPKSPTTKAPKCYPHNVDNNF